LSNLKRFFKDTIIYGLAAVLPRAINVILVKLHTHTLSSDKYAENTLFFVYAAYLNALLTFGMETAFFRFFTKEKEKGKVISTSFVSIFFVTLIFLGFGFYYSQSISNYFGFADALYLQILILVIVFDTLVVIPFAYLRVTNKPVKFAAIKILNICIYAFLNYYFLILLPKSQLAGGTEPIFIREFYEQHSLVIFIFISNLIASLVTFLILIPIILKFRFEFDKTLLKKMLVYGLPILVTSLAFVTNENLDKILLEKYLGKEQMGIYAACYKLGVFMVLFTMAFRLGAEPFFFNKAHDSNAKETYARIMTWFTAIGTVFLLTIVVFIDFFASLLLGNKIYFQGLSIVPIILFADLFLGISYNLAIWYKLTDKTSYGMVFSLIAAAITILFNILFIPVIGYMASAWATLLAYGLIAILSYLYGKKYYPIPYENKKMALYIAVSFVLSVLSFKLFRNNYYISALFLIAYGFLIYFNEKKELQNIFKK
jgi:O-antigen/teichoic acid export membrane protein